MRLLKKYRQLVIGLFIGSLLPFMSVTFWLWGSISLYQYGEVTFADFPKGISKVTFDSDLVAITVNNDSILSDYQFNPTLLARCKDKEYGEIVGMPYNDHFFFHYGNFITGPQGPAPLNDIHKIYPSTKWYKNAQQGGAGEPDTRHQSDSEGGDKPHSGSEGHSR